MIRLSITHSLKHFTFHCDLEWDAQGITAIFGRSGSGKTTLLNFIAGKIQPHQGYISINEQVLVDTSKRIHLPICKRNIGYVFQEANLFPHYSVRGNLEYGMSNKNPSRLQEIGDLLDIQHLLNERVAHLSGGEKQRIAIGRALLREPNILLMDEPLASLDSERKEEILRYLERIVETTTIPILYVTHNKEEVQRLAHRYIAVLEGKMTLLDISSLD